MLEIGIRDEGEHFMSTVWPAGVMNGIPAYVGLLLAVLAAAVGAGILYRSRKADKPAFRQTPGSKILLSIGNQFSPSDRFAGFIHEESGASIMLTELPAQTFEKMMKLGDAARSFAAEGVSGIVQLPLPSREGEYLYLRGEQNTQLVQYAKYILIFRAAELTGMVTANIPRAALTSGILTGAEIEKIMSSATIGPSG